MWKREDGRWAYYADALGENIEDVWITQAMRHASTTSAVLKLIRLHPPDTAAVAAPTRGVPSFTLFGVFVVSGLTAAWWLSRRRGRPTTQSEAITRSA